MCGIVGCILKDEEDVAPILFDCISKWNTGDMIQ